MIVKLLTEHHLEFLSLKEAPEARPSLHMSKCHNVGNLMHWLNYLYNFSLYLQQHDKILVLKRKYRPESHEDSNNDTTRASSEPPGGANMSSSGDRPDGVAPSKMRSDGNLSSFDNMLSASASSSISLGSCVSTSSLVW